MTVDLILGSCCATCGTRFTRSHGYPVLCEWCWSRTHPAARRAMRVGGVRVEKASRPEVDAQPDAHDVRHDPPHYRRPRP